jgi:hypothetical protein
MFPILDASETGFNRFVGSIIVGLDVYFLKIGPILGKLSNPLKLKWLRFSNSIDNWSFGGWSDKILTCLNLVEIQQVDTLSCVEFCCGFESELSFQIRPLLRQQFNNYVTLRAQKLPPFLPSITPNRPNSQKLTNFKPGICSPPGPFRK